MAAHGSSLSDLSEFLLKLDEAQIHYALTSIREGAVMVQVAVPGERWEIEFFPDRQPDVEVFRSNGDIGGPEAISALFRKHSDD